MHLILLGHQTFFSYAGTCEYVLEMDRNWKRYVQPLEGSVKIPAYV